MTDEMDMRQWRQCVDWSEDMALERVLMGTHIGEWMEWREDSVGS